MVVREPEHPRLYARVHELRQRGAQPQLYLHDWLATHGPDHGCVDAREIRPVHEHALVRVAGRARDLARDVAQPALGSK